MLGRKATKTTSLKLGEKIHSQYADSLGSKFKSRMTNPDEYVPTKDGQNLLTHKKQSPLEKLHNSY